MTGTFEVGDRVSVTNTDGAAFQLRAGMTGTVREVLPVFGEDSVAYLTLEWDDNVTDVESSGWLAKRFEKIEHTFKVGDIVRVKPGAMFKLASGRNTRVHERYIGKVGRIRRFHEDGDSYVGRIESREDSDDVGFVTPEHLELVEREEPVEPPEDSRPSIVVAAREVYVNVAEDERDIASRQRTKIGGVGDGNWIKTRGNDVLETGQGSLPSDEWRLERTMSTEQFQSFLVAVANQARSQRESVSRMQRIIEAAETWKEELVEAAHAEADRRGWCSDFDDFMESQGLPPRSKTYSVELEVQVRVSVNVTATSEDEALEAAESLDEDSVREAVLSDGFQRSWINGWSAETAERVED